MVTGTWDNAVGDFTEPAPEYPITLFCGCTRTTVLPPDTDAGRAYRAFASAQVCRQCRRTHPRLFV